MNYPLWDLPASGLLIAGVAIIHVFISHFAVGGGLFLVLTERRARLRGDAELLAFVKRHTRFFVLLTLVLGAMTGVGIWFTIGLVHPQATSTLINIFVWAWAIEWTFFVVEIAAAMVYYYGWDRLPAATHETIGWIYFVAAWLSLVVINGILSFMLTPGDWLVTRSFWDGLLNPTYVPSLVARTAASIGLAGLYALMTAAWMADPALKARIGRYATLYWILPMAVVLPLSLLWFLHAAAGAGVPVAEVFGAPNGSAGAILGAIVSGTTSGHPIAQFALRTALLASIAGLGLCLVVVRRERFGRPLAAAIMVAGFVALGAGEWVREDLRKPYVIGHYMFVNGVRAAQLGALDDPFTVDALNQNGVLTAARWHRLPVEHELATPDDRLVDEGREVFRLLCTSCHTQNGYLAIRPLVRGAAPATLRAMLPRLAEAPPSGWTDPHARLTTWRGRRMPPFVGTQAEADALAAYLAVVGGASRAGISASTTPTAEGPRLFEEHCAMCHGPDAIPLDPKGRTADELFELIGRLPSINEGMPPFAGSDAERRALAEHLATPSSNVGKEDQR